MTDLVAIYDPDLDLGAIVDMDTLQGFGPCYKGPMAKDLLQGFIDAMPFDLGVLSSEQVKDIFWGFHDNVMAQSQPENGTTDTGAVVADGEPTGSDIRTAETEAAANAGAPPTPQPADTDPGAAQDTSGAEVTPQAAETVPASIPGGEIGQVPATQVINCGLCNADGNGSTDPGCIACGGTGKLARLQ